MGEILKFLLAFCGDAAWAAWGIAWQYASTMRVHHSAEQQSKANEQDDDSHSMLYMDRHGIPPSIGLPSRSGNRIFPASNKVCQVFSTGSIVDIP
jgi:hypothetical protein